MLRFYAYAYDLETDRYLYTEVHEQRVVDGEWISGRTRFYTPDGVEFGRKTLDFAHDPFVPVYRLDFGRDYTEEITAVGAQVTMARRVGARSKSVRVDKTGLWCADSGLLRLLRARFEALQRGETLSFRLAAPSRLGHYRFRARRIEDAPFDGQPAVRIRVEMDSMLNLLAGPLLFTFEPTQRRLLEFRGATNVRDPATGDTYTVRTVYATVPPKGAPATLPPLEAP